MNKLIKVVIATIAIIALTVAGVLIGISSATIVFDTLKAQSSTYDYTYESCDRWIVSLPFQGLHWTPSYPAENSSSYGCLLDNIPNNTLTEICYPRSDIAANGAVRRYADDGGERIFIDYKCIYPL